MLYQKLIMHSERKQEKSFHLYGVILRESADANMVRKHVVQLLELSHQSSSDREVGRRPQAPQPLGLPQALGRAPPRSPGCCVTEVHAALPMGTR